MNKKNSTSRRVGRKTHQNVNNYKYLNFNYFYFDLSVELVGLSTHPTAFHF